MLPTAKWPVIRGTRRVRRVDMRRTDRQLCATATVAQVTVTVAFMPPR